MKGNAKRPRRIAAVACVTVCSVVVAIACWAGHGTTLCLLSACVALFLRSHGAFAAEEDPRDTVEHLRLQLEGERALHAVTKQDLLRSVSMVLAMLESNDDGMLVIDCEHGTLQFNRRLVDLWRIPPAIGRARELEAFLAHAEERFVGNDDLCAHLGAILEEDVGPQSGVAECRDGSVLEWHSFPQTIDGRFIGRVLSFRDVTEKRRADAALRESERRYRLLAENVSDVIWTLNLDLEVMHVSPSVTRAMGLSPTELQKQSLSEFLSPAAYQLIEKALERGLSLENDPEADPGRAYVVEFQERLADRQPLWLEVTFTHLREAGKTTGWIAVSRDITRRKREEELRQGLEAQMQRAQKLESLSLLAGGVAHDFNNLLSGIIGNASLANERLPADSPIRRYLDRIENTAMQAAELSRQMLAYSGRGQFVIDAIDLNSVIKEAAPLLRVSVGAKSAIRFRLDPELPLIQGDAEQIRQVVTNLVSNAGDALSDGGQVEVRTGVTAIDRAFLSQTYVDDSLPSGDYVFLEVSDTGHGMDLETQRRVFEPFFTTKFVGRGLGLPAVLGLVRGHHGAIHIASAPREGARVTVYLPTYPGGDKEAFAKARAADDNALFVVDEISMTASGELYHAKAGTRQGLVLIAEDEDTVREVATLTMEQLGFNVLATRDGVEAVEAFRECADRIVLVILDMAMPRLNGEQAFAEITSLRSDVPILLTTGLAEKEALQRLSSLHVAGCVQKPYLPSELSAKVRLVLGDR